MIAHIDATGNGLAEVRLPREWLRLGQDIVRNHAVTLLTAASLGGSWSASAINEDMDRDLLVIRCHRQRT